MTERLRIGVLMNPFTFERRRPGRSLEYNQALLNEFQGNTFILGEGVCQA